MSTSIFLHSISETAEIRRYTEHIHGGGATQGQVYQYLFSKIKRKKCPSDLHFLGGKTIHPHDHPALAHVAFPGGSSGSVGAVALLSNGGIGSMARTFGLAADHTVSFRIAVPPSIPLSSSLLSISSDEEKDRKEEKGRKEDRKEEKKRKEEKGKGREKGKAQLGVCSRVIVASTTENSELFWALRGGQAANFGIVLAVVCNTVRVGKVIFYSVSFPWSSPTIEAVVSLWQSTAPLRSSAFNEQLSLFAPGSRPNESSEPQFSLSGLYVIPSDSPNSEEEAKATIEKELTSLLTVAHGSELRFDALTNYQQAMERLADNRSYQPFSSTRVFFSRKPLQRDKGKRKLKFIIDQIEQAAKTLSGIHAFSIELLGGKTSEVAADATAYFPRKAKFFYDVFSYWDSSLDTCVNSRWVEDVFAGTYNRSPRTDTVYVGFPINGLPDHLSAYYGRNKHRLQAVKEVVDPLHILKFPTGIVQ